MSKENLNGLDVTKLDGASRKYYEAMQWADQHELEMLDRLLAEKQARENATGANKLDGASAKYLEALRREHQSEMAMLKRLVAEKQARESLETADAPLDKKPHE